MTKEQIEQMPAGREMDRLIATKVMRWHEVALKNGYEYWEIEDSNGDSRYIPVDSFRPSDFLIDAWDVIDRMRELHLVHDWESVFTDLTCFKWFLIKTGAFCLGVCRAALIITLEQEEQGKRGER